MKGSSAIEGQQTIVPLFTTEERNLAREGIQRHPSGLPAAGRKLSSGTESSGDAHTGSDGYMGW